MQTILHVNNPHVEAFRTAGASLTQLLNDHYVSNYTLADVQTRTDLDPELIAVNIDPIVPEGENPAVPAIMFDAAEDVIQEMSNATYHQLRKEHPSLFHEPEVEADPEPRYKTVMTSNEFTTLLGDELETSILTAAQANIEVLKYVNRMGWATYIDLNDPWVLEGLSKLKTVGLVTQTDIDRIMLGIEIK